MSDASTRGPNYDWKHEAEHYREECDKLRELLGKLDASGEALQIRCDRWEDTHREMVMERASIICERDQLRERVRLLEVVAAHARELPPGWGFHLALERLDELGKKG